MDKKQSLRKLKLLCDKLVRRPTRKDLDSCYYTPSASFYKWHFGSIFNALNLIYPDVYKHKERFTKQFLIEDFRRVKKILKYIPTLKDMRKYGKTEPTIYQRKFNSWNKFLKSQGISKYDLISRPGYINSQKTKHIYYAKDGHKCYSKGELIIDNMFVDLGITHEKEVKYPLHNKYNINGRLIADWKVGNMYVEYLGMLGYYNKKVRNKYMDSEQRKSLLLLSLGFNFMFIYPDTEKNIRNDIRNNFGGD